jgi:hypothetical protein
MNLGVSEYVCPAIQKWIALQESQAKVYTEQWQDMNTQLSLWIPPLFKNLAIPYLVETFRRCTQWIRSLPPSLPDKTKPWKIMIWLTPFSLQWCPAVHTNHDIGPCEVNSGETHFQTTGLTIRIYRIESLLRTLIHELLHACNWDRFAETNQKKYESENEALIEACARVLHCFWLQLNSADGTNRTIDSWIQSEFEYAWKKSQFLLSQFWVPKTHVVSYYLCSTAFLAHWRVFLSWIWNPEGQAWPYLRDTLIQKTFGTVLLQPAPEKIDHRRHPCVPLNMVRYQIIWPQSSDLVDGYAPLTIPVVVFR